MMLTHLNSPGVLYASTVASGVSGTQLLKTATSEFLDAVQETPIPVALWSMQYEQTVPPDPQSSPPETQPHGADQNIVLAPMPLDLAFDDAVIETVRDAWRRISGDKVEDAPFMVFEDREALANADESDEDTT